MIEDVYGNRLYKYMYKLAYYIVVFCWPHKFGDFANARIPFTKVDINPKYFECFDHLLSHLLAIFNDTLLTSNSFNISNFV